MNDIAVKAEGLSKYYRLGIINNGALFRDIQTWIALKRGKEDPWSKIGEHKYDSTKEGFWALQDLNFEIHQGDRVGIIGKNGAGKSTLLKILSRITAPTEGDIKIKGRIASLLEVGTGFHPELTGRENIYLNGAILGMKRREVDKKIDEIIEFSEIGDHIDTPVKRYSSGMYVRLAFAVAAHLDSEILIADEVLAVGDAAFQKKAIGKMNDLSTGQGRTVLFVSHQMAAVKTLCNKGIVLEHGTIKRQDDNINDSINFYLGLTDKNSSKTESWYNDGNYKNDTYYPLKIEFLDDNNLPVTSALSYNKPYKIRFQFEVQGKESLNMEIFLRILRGSESVLDMKVPDEIFNYGSYSYDFYINKQTFLPGIYTVILGTTIKKIKWLFNPDNHEIHARFEVLSDAGNELFIGTKN
jgi:lipopolysaccharide transport system ATP-binding protein